MDKYNVDNILNIVNEEKKKRGLENYVPLYPTFMNKDGKLYVTVMITNMDDNVWDRDSNVVAEYWVLLDAKTLDILEFNKTSDKAFSEKILTKYDNSNKQIENSKFIVNKKIQYKNYLMEDIKNSKYPFQEEVSKVIGNKTYFDGKLVDFDDYVFSGVEEDISNKIDELIDLISVTKYGSTTFYYYTLVSDILKEYNDTDKINNEKLKLCLKLISYYYDGVVGLKEMFNI